jgi:spore maturation protein CgeB
MRIFTAVRHSVDPRFYYGGLWSGNFYPALQSLGHGVVESQVDLFPASKFMHIRGEFTREELEARSRLTEQIIEEVQRAHREKPLHLFLSYFYNSHFDPNGFREIARLGIPTVNFYCNSIYQFDLVSSISVAVDFAWHAERDAKAQYQAVGANPVWVQMGADPAVYRPSASLSRIAKACFVGQRYADRDRLMAALVKAGVPLAIYGSGWTHNGSKSPKGMGTEAEENEYLGRRISRPATFESYLQVLRQNVNGEGIIDGIAHSWRQKQYKRKTQQLSPLFAEFAHGAISFERMCRAFSEHAVTLNFSNVWADGRAGSKLIPHVRLRDFEAPMCRAFYLTGHSDEIAEFYELGKEIVTYSDPAELVDKTKYYLSHPYEADGIREAGYRRALRDHTWVERFKQLFSAIGFKNSVVVFT